ETTFIHERGSGRGTFWSRTNAARPGKHSSAISASPCEMKTPRPCVSLERSALRVTRSRAGPGGAPDPPRPQNKPCPLCPGAASCPRREPGEPGTPSHKRETAMRRPLILSLCVLLAPALAPAHAPAQGRAGAEGHTTVPPLAPLVAAPAS